MSKRTIIIGVIAILSVVAVVLSMYFEYKKTIDEANRILSGETETETKPKPAKVKPAKVEPVETVKDEENGNGTE